jgi:hypothetical protein
MSDALDFLRMRMNNNRMSRAKDEALFLMQVAVKLRRPNAFLEVQLPV